jgi:glycosyltransferase involved in cell wall biosynthesis
MKIGFVNQPFDTITPPGQNSVGYYTYGVACELAKSCKVIIYGLQASHFGSRAGLCNPNIDLRLLPSTQFDQFSYKARTKCGKLFNIKMPISTSKLLFPAYGRQVAKDLREERCDVIHIQHCSQYVPIIRAMNPTAKIVLHIHAEWFSQSNLEILRRRLDGVDSLLTVSDHITRKCRREFPSIADRCETVYCGIDPKEFSRVKDYTAATRRREKRILYTGAISPHKGIHVLVDAFNLVARRHSNVRLDLVGNPMSYPIEESFDMNDRAKVKSVAPFYAKQRLERLKAKLSLAPRDAGTYQAHLKGRLAAEVRAKVSFRGHFSFRKELVDSYYDADVFCFTPVWEEGFGLPPLEAMAAGTPVLGSRSGALPETIQDGKTGFLSDKNDAKSLADQIVLLLENDALRSATGQAARQRALTHYTWEGIADKLYHHYQALASARAPIGNEREVVGGGIMSDDRDRPIKKPLHFANKRDCR